MESDGDPNGDILQRLGEDMKLTLDSVSIYTDKCKRGDIKMAEIWKVNFHTYNEKNVQYKPQ